MTTDRVQGPDQSSALVADTHDAAPFAATHHGRDRTRGRYDRGLVAIVAVQAVWLWWAYSRGWFLQADLSNLADGADRTLDWAYVSTPLGGHFAPVARLTYWLFDQVARLNYSATVIFRVVCQAVATVLLSRVLVKLVGSSALVTALVASYALSPVMLGGAAWFTSGSTLVVGQIFVLLMIESHLRYEVTGALRDAAVTGLLLALAVLTFDQWIVVVFVPPLLSFVHLYSGGIGTRTRTFLRRWPAWLLVFAPVGAVLVALLKLGNAVGAAPMTFGDSYDLLRESWLKTIGPSWAGGPWRWYADSNTFVSYALPPDWMILLGQLAVLVIVLVGVQRTGLRSLAAWIMPVVCGVVSILLVGYGRFGTYGVLLAITPRYLFELVPLFVLGAALALMPTIVQSDTGRAAPQPSFDTAQRIIGAVGFVAIIAMSLVSGARFASRLERSPVQNYVQTLETSARSYGSNVNIYDTAVPQSVISSYEPSHRVSDILKLAKVPARFDAAGSEPLVVTPDGHLTQAIFVAGATAVPMTGGSCGSFVHGTGTWTLRLDKPLVRNEWFLRLRLYQATASDISIEVLDDHGQVAAPITGRTVHLGQLEARVLALPLFAPSAIRIHSADAGTNLCLTQITVGGPFAAGGTR